MRYFLEVSYKGTRYSGFQIQQTGSTIQGAIQKALSIFLKQPLVLTGSSRTDSGVHAQQNFFHFDCVQSFDPNWIYNLNAILPADIVIKNIFEVPPDAHSRFDAGSRSYQYNLYRFKNPFLADTAYYFPYKLDEEELQTAATLIKEYTDFTSFSKKIHRSKPASALLSKANGVQRNTDCITRLPPTVFYGGWCVPW